MMRLIPFCILLSAMLPGMGCKTHVPMVRNHEGVYQYKAEAAEHWRVMANTMADGLYWRISNVPWLRGSPIVIEPPQPGASEFDQAYHEMLMVRMLNLEPLSQPQNGIATPGDALLHVTFRTQLVEHGDRRWLENATTCFAALGYGVQHFFTGDSTGSDWICSPQSTRKDLIVTALVTKNGVTLFGDTQIVYVPPGDAFLYQVAKDSKATHFSFGPAWDRFAENP